MENKNTCNLQDVIEKNLDKYGIISFEVINKSVWLNTRKGYAYVASCFVRELCNQFPDQVNGGNAKEI